MESRAARSVEVERSPGDRPRLRDDPVWSRRSAVDGNGTPCAVLALVEGAMRYGSVRTTPGGEAVAVSAPPGGAS